MGKREWSDDEEIHEARVRSRRFDAALQFLDDAVADAEAYQTEQEASSSVSEVTDGTS